MQAAASNNRTGPAVLAAAALFVIACTITALRIWQVLLPLGTYGAQFDYARSTYARSTIASVDAGSPAARAGLRAGDRLNAQTSSSDARAFSDVNPPLAGQKIHLTVDRAGASLHATLRANPRYASLGDMVQIVTYYLSVLLFVVIAGFVLTLRPGRMTWALFAIAAGLAINPISVLHRPDTWAALQVVVIDASSAVLSVGLLVFIARFPDDRASGWTRWLETAAWSYWALSTALLVYDRLSPQASSRSWEPLAGIIPFLAAILLLTAKLASLRGADRQRLAWVTASLLIFAVCFIPNEFFDNPPLELLIATNLAQMLVPLAIAYAIVKHRVIDIRFAISRAVVYTILTSCVIGLFALLDWTIGTLLAQTRLALAVSIACSIAIGYWLNSLHVRVDREIDRVLFRDRHEAERRLARIAAGLQHTDSLNALSVALVDEPMRNLRLVSAALFLRHEHEAYELAASANWGMETRAAIAATNPLVLHLQGERGLLQLHGIAQSPAFPSGEREPILALPVIVREIIEAIVLYGAHEGGEDLDPDERQSLETLASAASIAFERARSKATEEALESARQEAAALRERLRTLGAAGPGEPDPNHPLPC